MRTLLPLDSETILASVKKTNKLLVVHEDTRTGGIAGEIAALVFEERIRGSRRARCAASPRWIRRCRTRRPSKNTFYPTPKKLPLPRGNWQNTKADERQDRNVGKTKGINNAEFEVGSEVRIADRAFLESFLEAGQYHNELEPEQLDYAGHVAKVKDVDFFTAATKFTRSKASRRVARGMSQRRLDSFAGSRLAARAGFYRRKPWL